MINCSWDRPQAALKGQLWRFSFSFGFVDSETQMGRQTFSGCEPQSKLWPWIQVSSSRSALDLMKLPQGYLNRSLPFASEILLLKWTSAPLWEGDRGNIFSPLLWNKIPAGPKQAMTSLSKISLEENALSWGSQPIRPPEDWAVQKWWWGKGWGKGSSRGNEAVANCGGGPPPCCWATRKT